MTRDFNRCPACDGVGRIEYANSLSRPCKLCEESGEVEHGMFDSLHAKPPHMSDDAWKSCLIDLHRMAADELEDELRAEREKTKTKRALRANGVVT